MSPAQTLRDAAALLRERAEAVDGGAWYVNREAPDPAALAGFARAFAEVAAYIATTAPPFALAVAAWLDTCAYLAEHGDDGGPRLRDHALDVARVVLGGGADE